jgi:Xaa-Pro dipeptidase
LIHHDTGKAVLFVPFLDENYQLWMVVKTPEELKQEYRVDEVRYVHELRAYLEQNHSTIYLFSGVDSDSGLSVEEPSAEYLQGFDVDRTTLWPLISNLRAVKTPD